jgi:hypothetical protein
VRSIVLVDAKRLRLSRRKGAQLEPFPFIGEKKGDETYVIQAMTNTFTGHA